MMGLGLLGAVRSDGIDFRLVRWAYDPRLPGGPGWEVARAKQWRESVSKGGGQRAGLGPPVWLRLHERLRKTVWHGAAWRQKALQTLQGFKFCWWAWQASNPRPAD